MNPHKYCKTKMNYNVFNPAKTNGKSIFFVSFESKRNVALPLAPNEGSTD